LYNHPNNTLGAKMSEKKPLPVNEYRYIKHNIGNGKPTILAFGMSHCYSCLAMSKVFAEVLEVHPEFQIYSIDGQKERLVSRDIYKLKEMPTQIFFDASGKEVFRHTGAYKKAVLKIILKKYGFDD
jgi:thioredoxin 1